MDLNKLIRIKKITYKSGVIKNPFNNKENKIIFADDTASGRPCKIIDKYISEYVYPYYANTHSNATCGILMKNMIRDTINKIRNLMNVSDNYKIIFSGNGCTGAVNHLVGKIDFDKYDSVFIHTTPYEHHSNFLPWKEKISKHKNACINFIETDNTFNLLIDNYISKLDIELSKSNKSRLDIFALTACSNVTGKRYDLSYNSLWKYIKEKKDKHNIYLFLDYACSAPHVDIDLSKSDGVYFSGHKFLGGQSTPGILIINNDLLQIERPYEPGGGCVEKADDKCVIYKADPEIRELGGTPNIIGIIRFGYVLMLKQYIYDIIKSNEKIITAYLDNKFRELEKKYSSFKVIGLNNRSPNDLPIYPITIEGLHYNLITVLLNDLYGIQSRGGISCCGVFGRLCKDLYNINGWCRLTFNFLLSEQEIITIINAIEYIIINGKNFIDKYDYNPQTNLFSLK